MKCVAQCVVVLSVVAGMVGAFGVQEGLSAEKKLVIAGRDGSYGDALQFAVDAYKKANADVEIELLKLPYAGLMEKVVIDLKEATGAYDLLMMDDTWVTGFASANWLTNLTELMKANGQDVDPDFVPAALRSLLMAMVPRPGVEA